LLKDSIPYVLVVTWFEDLISWVFARYILAVYIQGFRVVLFVVLCVMTIVITVLARFILVLLK